jgi:hypothetical protein
MTFEDFVNKVHKTVDSFGASHLQSPEVTQRELDTLEQERAEIDRERRAEILRRAVNAERHPVLNRFQVAAENYLRSTPLNLFMRPKLRAQEYNRAKPAAALPVVEEAVIAPKPVQPAGTRPPQAPPMFRKMTQAEVQAAFAKAQGNPFELIRNAPRVPPVKSNAEILGIPEEEEYKTEPFKKRYQAANENALKAVELEMQNKKASPNSRRMTLEEYNARVERDREEAAAKRQEA